jgi:hypothetical protein
VVHASRSGYFLGIGFFGFVPFFLAWGFFGFLGVLPSLRGIAVAFPSRHLEGVLRSLLTLLPPRTRESVPLPLAPLVAALASGLVGRPTAVSWHRASFFLT